VALLQTPTDQELFIRLKEGDAASFEEIYKRYWKKLLHFATQKSGDIVDAENIVQDVFVSLWNRREELQINSKVENYLIVSVKYRVIKFLDKQRSKRVYETHQSATTDILDDSTQQYLDFDELQDRLAELIGNLPEKAALIFKMSREEGMSHKSIANELGMSEKAVNAQLVRTRKSLRTSLNALLHSVLL